MVQYTVLSVPSSRYFYLTSMTDHEPNESSNESSSESSSRAANPSSADNSSKIVCYLLEGDCIQDIDLSDFFF